MILLITACLSEPPTEPLALRDLTADCHYKSRLDVLIEVVEKSLVDSYYSYLKQLGLLDFVEEIVTPEEENGIRLDTKIIKPFTIKADRITILNKDRLFKNIDFLSSH